MVDNYVGVKIDFVNAFNCANRSIMVQGMAQKFPELASYIYWSKGYFDNAQDLPYTSINIRSTLLKVVNKELR
jgi:hypothetical protein